MEKHRINILFNNPSEAIEDDVLLLEEEIQKYPYAQVLHILLAKIKFLLNASDKNIKLTSAAIYSGDRSILKKIILESNFPYRHEKITPFQSLPKIAIQESSTEPDSDPEIQIEEKNSTAIFAEVLKNLEQLKALRQQFQFLELEDPSPKVEETQGSEIQIVAPKIDPPGKPHFKIKETQEPKPSKKKNENADAKKSEIKKKKLDEILQKDLELDSQVNFFFLKEIEKNKESLEKKPTNKLVVQNEIIERFIVEQPSIGSLKKEADRKNDETNRDLAEKSTKFNEELISENLAIIMLKQGKKERAIDIYKKLIWKLPQKKAYFAARIEEINK